MARKKTPKRGGVRENAGRKSMFSPKTEKLAVKVTKLCKDLVTQTNIELAEKYGRSSDGDALEYLCRKARRVALTAPG